MKAKNPIPWGNRNATGWWIASYIERFEYYDEPKRALSRRCLAWKNTIIVKARNRDEAHKKALAVGRRVEGLEAWNKRGRKGAWRFEGLTMLLPIYDELEDGAEILWAEFDGWTVRKIKAMVPRKEELEAFDDREEGDAPKKRRRTSRKKRNTVAKAVDKHARGTSKRTRGALSK